MKVEQGNITSGLSNFSQVTARLALLAAEAAASEGHQAEAERLLSVAHELFGQKLAQNYVPIDWIEDADDR